MVTANRPNCRSTAPGFWDSATAERDSDIINMGIINIGVIKMGIIKSSENLRWPRFGQAFGPQTTT